MIDNLRLKHDIDPAIQSSLNTQLFQKNLNYLSYQAGELILFENYKKVGLVIEINPESLKVLDEQNKLVNVN